MKILQIVDTPVWAIGHLSKSIVEHNPHLQFKTIYVHPKHVAEHLDEVRAELDWCDVVDFQYWNTARQLLELMPELRRKPSMLTHHNEKDLLGADWDLLDINLHIVETKRSQEILEEKYPGRVRLSVLAADLTVFTYNEEPEKHDVPIVGYVGRVVPWKGLKEIAKACFELGYKLKLMGKFDKPDYWASIPYEHQEIVDMEFMDCEDDDRINFYRSIDVYVGNSSAGRETGPLGLIEAMASGVPVVTTAAGIAADIIEDQENGILIPFENYEALKTSLRLLMQNEELQQKIRKAGWNTIKNHPIRKRAWQYEKFYHEIYSSEPLVSVIIPTTPDKPELLAKILEALQVSDYKHIEVVVCCDQVLVPQDPESMKYLRETYNFPIKLLASGLLEGYNLARCRNMAAIEAIGEYLMFCDNRMCPVPDAITNFREAKRRLQTSKVWLFGNKGTAKQTFVENFSFIRRDEFIRAGMFNERIDRYGGMSQEVRERFMYQGFICKYVDDARATQLKSSHMTNARRADIVESKLKLAKMGLG